MGVPDQKVELDILDIMEILPHRYPLLLVDKILEVNLEEKRIVGQKNVTMNEIFFQGHFPGNPIMPGVLVLEALAQTGGFLIYKQGHNRGKAAVLLSIDKAKFRKPVLPGDVLRLCVQGMYLGSRGGKVKGEAYVNDAIVVEAEIGFGFSLRKLQ